MGGAVQWPANLRHIPHAHRGGPDDTRLAAGFRPPPVINTSPRWQPGFGVDNSNLTTRPSPTWAASPVQTSGSYELSGFEMKKWLPAILLRLRLGRRGVVLSSSPLPKESQIAGNPGQGESPGTTPGYFVRTAEWCRGLNSGFVRSRTQPHPRVPVSPPPMPLPLRHCHLFWFSGLYSEHGARDRVEQHARHYQSVSFHVRREPGWH